MPSSKRTTARASVRGSILAPAESAAAVCSKRLFGSSLSVVSRCTPAFQSKAPRAPDVAPRKRCQSAEPPSPSARSDGLSPGPRAAGLQADDPGERVRPVEAARRAAHDLDALELEGHGGAEVEGAARLVHRHAVHEHARVARLAPADEDGGLEARLAGARGGDARHLLQERQERGRRPVVDALAVEHVGGDAERGERRLPAGRAHHHALGDGRRGEDEVELARPGGRAGLPTRDRRGLAQLEAGGVDRRRVLAGRQAVDPEGAVGPGGHAALAGRSVEGDRDAGEREAVARADDALERAGRRSAAAAAAPTAKEERDDGKGKGAKVNQVLPHARSL